MESKTSLITGACGFIGSHIAERLKNMGHHAILVDNMKTGKIENITPWFDRKTCTFVNADVSELSAIRHLFQGVDYVLHNAASKCTVCTEDPRRDLMVNALGTLNVCVAAQEAGVKKVIHASTGSVNEINSYYGNSKNTGEQYLRVFRNYHPDFNYTALRYHHVYGPRQDASDKGGVIPIFIRNIQADKPITIFGDGEQTRHFTHVDDVVDANIFCLEHPETDGKVFNVIPWQTTTINALAAILGELMGKSVLIQRTHEKPGDIRQFTATSKDILDLGFEFERPLREGLLNTINWYVEKWRKAA